VRAAPEGHAQARSRNDALGRQALAELVGSAFLLAAVVGSGIMATRLTDDVGLQLLINSAATAGALIALILSLGPVSGAHLNPLVTLTDRWFGGVSSTTAAVYVAAQVAGAVVGVTLANLMFDLAAINVSSHTRTGGGVWLGEVVATVGLLLVILGLVRSGRSAATPFAVGAYIGAAYFFTSSTSFANPAVTVARTLSDTFAGIAPVSVPAFVFFELIGATIAIGLATLLFRRSDP
jgi:arsenate reductase